MTSSKKISELTKLATAADGDLIPIVDTSEGETKYIEKSDLVPASSGAERLTATGLVDDSNKTFTFEEEPTYIIINGVMYPKATSIFNWSWTAGTLTATLAVPVGAGGFIEGLVL